MIGMLTYDGALPRFRTKEAPLTLGRRQLWRVAVHSPGRRKHAARCLARRGVRTLLLPREEERSWWLKAGFRLAPVAAFCRAQAPALALAALKGQGWLPRDSVVALRGDRVTPELRQTAVALGPSVKGLLLPAGEEGERLAEELYYTYGMGIQCSGEAWARVAVDFSPQDSRRSLPVTFRLYGEVPDLCHARFRGLEVHLPEDCDTLEALAALWNCGALERENLAIEWA